MDVLSDILRQLKFRSAVYFKSDFSQPWGMKMDKSGFAQFHIIDKGRCWLKVGARGAPFIVSKGDILLFPFGKEHWLADDPETFKTPGKQVLEQIISGSNPFKKNDEKNYSFTLICGHFELDTEWDHPFLDALPEFIHIEGNSLHEYEWMQNAVNLIISETGTGKQGSEELVLRVAEILFLQVVRAFIHKNGVKKSFLAALSDKKIVKALKFIHGNIDKNLTVEELAKHLGMSRSSFSNLFHAKVGMPPISYLTNWRLNVAYKLLKINDQNLTLLEIAERVGYSSESSFHKAFKRKYQKTPGQIKRDYAI